MLNRTVRLKETIFLM